MVIKQVLAASILTAASLAHAQPVSPNDPSYCEKVGQMSENMVAGAKSHSMSVEDVYKLNRQNFAAGTAPELMVANIDMAYEYYQAAKLENFHKSPAEICREDNAMSGSITPYDLQAK
jgi:hypothetical protein